MAAPLKEQPGASADFELHSNEDEKKKRLGTIWWRAPRQLRKWGETETLPHINWGDLFFDLFYVAAAYNLAYVLKNDPTLLGVLYFIGCANPIMWIFWNDRTTWNSMFDESDGDIGHRVGEINQLTLLATAVLHIRPVQYMSDVAEPEMLIFGTVTCLGNMVGISRLYEIGFIWVEGDEGARHVVKRDMIARIPSTLMTFAAAIFSAVKYFGPDDSSGDDYNRILAPGGGNESRSHFPIIMMASQLIIWPLSQYIVDAWFVKDFEWKEKSVPVNVEFLIHRFGELSMLLLGECILSLLIVSRESSRQYYLTFYAGILSVISLQHLNYSYQPHHAEHHALNRSRIQGHIFKFLSILNGLALVVVGASYKMFLTEFTDEYTDYDSSYGQDAYDDNYRMLFSQSHSFGGDMGRSLAGGGGGVVSKIPIETRRQYIANLFCCGLTIVYICQDLIVASHFDYNKPRTSTTTTMGVIMMIAHMAVIILTATLSQIITDPLRVPSVGFALILVQVILAVAGKHVLFNGDPHAEEQSSASV